MALLMFIVVCLVLLSGYPVAFSLGGTALIFAGLGAMFDVFDSTFLMVIPNRLSGIMKNTTLMAVPLFVFMGVMLEKSKVAEDLLVTMSRVMRSIPGGLGLSVVFVGMLMAASTGIVGATVVTMGVLTLPTMLKAKYNPAIATGAICATGTLGQIIPPSIALVLLGDVLSSAYQTAQREMGIYSPKTVSIGDLFAGAVIPGLLLVLCYFVFLWAVALIKPQWAPADESDEQEENSNIYIQVVKAMLPPLVLIIAVLGTILTGLVTPTEGAGVGAAGALVLAIVRGTFSFRTLQAVTQETLRITAMVFFILVGATIFSLVFRGYGGDELIQELFEGIPFGASGMLFVTMLVVFLLGFLLDFIEITFVVVPLVGPILLAQGIDPVWLGVMLAVNLQTSFLTPPFGFALFYLRGVAPDEVKTIEIYRGVAPFVLMQIVVMVALCIWPQLATWLPEVLYGT